MNRSKRRWVAKLSGATALVMAVSVALPLLALAQSYIYKATYDKSTGTVTASVYTDETVTGNVYLNIMDHAMSVIDSVYLAAPTGSYTVGESVYDRYDFSYTVTRNVYDVLNLASFYYDGTETVTSAVYRVASTHTPPPPAGGGGGGYWPGPVETPQRGSVIAATDGTVQASDLARALSEENVVTIELRGDLALLPAGTLMQAAEGKILVISKDGVTWTLPLTVLDFEALADATDTAAEEMTIRVGIQALEGTEATAITAAASRLQATLRSDAVAFELAAIGDDNREAEINDFGRTYVERTLPVESGSDASQLIGARYDAGENELVFVPTQLVYDEEGRVTAATMKRPGNSIYTVVERTKSFLDIAGHWAQDEVEEMAGKLLVEGVSSQQFEPNRSITRAEFATLLVRSLGLTWKPAANADFSDVTRTDWFAAAVATAADAELINGYPDGSFQPNATITRAEMAAMIVRAIEYVKGAPPQMSISPNQIRTALAGYTDANELDWAKTYVAITVHEGIIEGMTPTTLVPTGQATRAQAATMLQRWLSNINFLG